MATLTNEFLREQKVKVVMYCGKEHYIQNVTEKNIMLKQCSKIDRGNRGRYNSGRYRLENHENATEWYLRTRVVK